VTSSDEDTINLGLPASLGVTETNDLDVLQDSSPSGALRLVEVVRADSGSSVPYRGIMSVDTTNNRLKYDFDTRGVAVEYFSFEEAYK
jgi:hypothetical protein